MSQDAPKSSQKFLFLEFLDADVNGLLTALRREFSGDSNDSIHVTIRGPYTTPITSNEIAKYSRILSEEPILIHGVGMFRNGDECVVFLKASSKRLRQIWWKPDYPVSSHGVNAHISLYRGNDCALGERIRDFLHNEGLRLICHEFRLTPYTSKQAELFPFERVPSEENFLNLSNRRLVRADIVQRAANLVRNYRRNERRVALGLSGSDTL